MPSGSHGGGGGGHSFGGSSARGSSRTKPAYVHRHNIYYPPHRYYFFGRTYSVGSLRYYRMAQVGKWVFFMVIALVLCSVMFFQNQTEINQIKSDQEYYFNMIETAESGQYMNAKVTGQFQGDGGKYYITYNLVVNGYDLWFEDGYTYAIYTVSEASEIFRAGEIEIVVDGLPVNYTTDSINANYMDFDISQDGSYIEAVRYRTYLLIAGSIAIMGLIGASSYYFKLMFSYQMTEEQKSQYTNVTMHKDSGEKTEYCLYCGSVMSKSDKKCPHCGAARSYS